jgi:hypothetical protein
MSETPMLLHVITLALGLIIAFGLQQLIALFQRRRRERDRDPQTASSAQETTPAPQEPPPHA